MGGVSPAVKMSLLEFEKKGNRRHKIVNYKGELGKDFNPVAEGISEWR